MPLYVIDIQSLPQVWKIREMVFQVKVISVRFSTCFLAIPFNTSEKHPHNLYQCSQYETQTGIVDVSQGYGRLSHIYVANSDLYLVLAQ